MKRLLKNKKILIKKSQNFKNKMKVYLNKINNFKKKLINQGVRKINKQLKLKFFIYFFFNVGPKVETSLKKRRSSSF